MKKTIKIGLLVLFACLFVTGCGCSKEKYVVEFDSNGGSLVSSQIIEKNAKVKEPEAPTREGYSFLGWFLYLNDEDSYDFNSNVTSDLTLIAKWKSLGDDTTCNLTCKEGYELDEEKCSCEKTEPTEVSVTDVSVDKSSVRLEVGQSTTIVVTINPSDATDKNMTWKSSNEKVATVKDGKIVAVGVGTATVTVTVDGKTATITVTVISQEQVQKETNQANLNSALANITSKKIEKGNTNIPTYSSNGCTITLKTASPNDEKTIIQNGVVNQLYRAASNTTIEATYEVKCGSLVETKKIEHTVPKSEYTYTSDYNILYVIKVSGGVTNYILDAHDGSMLGLRYLEAKKGVQIGGHKKGTLYDMTLDSDKTTIYAVTSAE